MATVDRSAFRFFFAHAGYSSPPGRAACALSLARAEALLERAVALEVASVEWVDDDAPYDPGDVDSPEDVARWFESGRWTGPFGCVVATHAQPEDFGERFRVWDPDRRREPIATESLWGIVVGSRGTDDPYCRVVAAELASELEDDLRQAIGDALDARAEVSA